MLDFKKLAEVTSIEDLPEGINVLVNDDGVVKQVPANKVGEMVPDALKKAAESGDGFGYADGDDIHQIDSKYIKGEELVPEEVANAIENDGIGYMYDRTVNEINITWDGEIDNKPTIDHAYDDSPYLVRISDKWIPFEDIIGAIVTINDSDESFYEISKYDSMEIFPGGYMSEIEINEKSYTYLVAEHPNEIFDLSIPSKGVYVEVPSEYNPNFIQSIYLDEHTVTSAHCIDSKFLKDVDHFDVIDDNEIIYSFTGATNGVHFIRFNNQADSPELRVGNNYNYVSIFNDYIHKYPYDMGNSEFILSGEGLTITRSVATGPSFMLDSNEDGGMSYEGSFDEHPLRWEKTWQELFGNYVFLDKYYTSTTPSATPQEAKALMHRSPLFFIVRPSSASDFMDHSKDYSLGSAIIDENGNPCWVRFDKTTKEFTVLVEVVDDEWVFHLD